MVETQAPGLTGWCGLADAARLAGIPRSSFDEACARGEVVFVWTPLGRLFRIDDVEAFAAERRARRHEEAHHGH